MKRATIALLVMAGFLAGCQESQQEDDVYDQCLRAQIFQTCMQNVPKGPEHLTASGNDWDEVIQQCENAAAYQSQRPRAAVDPKCQSGGRGL